MGVIPLQFMDGNSAESLGLDGTETYDIVGIAGDPEPGATMRVTAMRTDATQVGFEARSRIDTAVEVEYYRHGGILQMVLRELLEA
jgi:aconitate hydratase